MSAQLNIEGTIIQLDQEITYNFQLGDIADFSRLKSNYTSAFQIPKTQDVVRLFDGLGIPSDMSNRPYRITNVQCLDDYVVVYEGTLVVIKSDREYYQCTVVSGVQDLSGVLGDATLLDIIGSQIKLKTPFIVGESVVSGAVANNYFTLTNFGGLRMLQDKEGAFNVDVITQSFMVSYVVDGIFNLAGFTYSIPDSIDLTDEMVSMPIPPLLDYAAEGTFHIYAQRSSNVINLNPPVDNPSVEGWNFWTYGIDGTVDMINGTSPISDRFMRFSQNGTYIIKFPRFVAWMRQIVPGQRYGMIVELLLSNRVIGRFTSSVTETDEDPIYMTIANVIAGDDLRYRLLTPPGISVDESRQYQIVNAEIRIFNAEVSQDKIKPYLSFKLTDFIKEFCYRYQLIPVQDGNHVNFISYYDIFDNWDIKDWSDKYIDRPEESYTLDYAQHNWLRHSYAEEGVDSYDLSLDTGNMNTAVNKNLVESKIFAPQGNVYETYERKGDSNDHKTINRIFFLKRVSIPPIDEIYFASGTVPGGFRPLNYSGLNSSVYTAAFSDSERWKSLRRIIENLRVHNIDLNLTTTDVYDLDIGKIYYFQQEQSYYILNRLRYTKEDVAKGEFIKIGCGGYND